MRLVLVIIFGLLMQQAWAGEAKPDEEQKNTAALRTELSAGIKAGDLKLIQAPLERYASTGVSKEALQREVAGAQVEAVLNELSFEKAGRLEAWVLMVAAANGDAKAGSKLAEYAAAKLEDFDGIKDKRTDHSRMRELWRHVHALECLGLMKDRGALSKLVNYVDIPFEEIVAGLRPFEEEQKQDEEKEEPQVGVDLFADADAEGASEGYVDSFYGDHGYYASPRQIASTLALKALVKLKYSDVTKIAIKWLEPKGMTNRPQPQGIQDKDKDNKSKAELLVRRMYRKRADVALECLYQYGKKKALDEAVATLDNNTIELVDRLEILQVFQATIWSSKHNRVDPRIAKCLDQEMLFEKFKSFIAKLDGNLSLNTSQTLIWTVETMFGDQKKEGQKLLQTFVNEKLTAKVKEQLIADPVMHNSLLSVGLVGEKGPLKTSPSVNVEF